MTEPILRLENVGLGNGTLQVVFDARLELRPGELVGLVGGNGSGKPTILRAVSGMIEPFAGRILFDGEAVGRVRPHEMAMKGLAHVPMGRQLFPNLSVDENLMLGAFLPAPRAKRDQSLAEVRALLPDLVRFAGTPAAALSGGQQQMVAIARALMLRPKMLIMHEPSLGLSPLLVKDVMAAIRRVAETGMPILLVEQNVRQAPEHSRPGLCPRERPAGSRGTVARAPRASTDPESISRPLRPAHCGRPQHHLRRAQSLVEPVANALEASSR